MSYNETILKNSEHSGQLIIVLDTWTNHLFGIGLIIAFLVGITIYEFRKTDDFIGSLISGSSAAAVISFLFMLGIGLFPLVSS